MWVRAPLWPHVRRAKFCLQVCQVVFLGVLPFSPHLLIGPSHMSWNNLERDVKLNQKKKRKKNSPDAAHLVLKILEQPFFLFLWLKKSICQLMFNSFKPGIPFMDIGKQNSPRCDAAERGVPSGAILFAKRIFIKNLFKNWRSLLMPLKIKVASPKW